MVVNISNSEGLNDYNDKLVLMDFYADWCQPCKSLDPVLKELESGYPDLIIAKCNIEDNDELLDRYSIRNVPTLIFIKNNKIENKLVGLKSKESIESVIKNLL